MKSSSEDDHHWRFVTNHAHVLQCISADPDSRLRDIAASVGITERTAAHIVSDLERAGYTTKPATDDAIATRFMASRRSGIPGPSPAPPTLIRFLQGRETAAASRS